MSKFPIGSRVKISEVGHKEWGHSDDNPDCPGTVVIDSTPWSGSWVRVAFDSGVYNSYSDDTQLEPVNEGPLVLVIFRAERSRRPEVTAVFPAQGYPSWRGFACYAHLGQHSACTREWYRTTRPATSAEYVPLLRELESQGYNLQIITKWPRTKKETS